MADVKRDSHQAADAADREGRAEALLVEGLDHYFAGRYDDAIHIWTRVLFLDRGHARARAYIERARTALAEYQRRADEILHVTDDLVGRGDVDEARRLLTRAVEIAGEDERVADLRTRLDRLERAAGRPRVAASAPHVSHDPATRAPRRRHLTSGVALLAAGASGALLVAALTSPAVHDWLGARSGSPNVAPAVAGPPLPVLSRSEVALIRARTLYARGRLADALAALDRVEPNSSARVDADPLRVQIQSILLATRPLAGPPSADRLLPGRP